MKRIPFFLPMLSCPHRCVYCDQNRITGQTVAPKPSDVAQSLSSVNEPAEVCFFGGSFSCMSPDLQRLYLEAASAAPSGSVVRFSTHPRCVSEDRIGLLSPFPISMVELGISSLDDEVLATCRRGYGEEEALSAVSRLLDAGLTTGVQLMIGLPGQSMESSLRDLRLLASVKGPRGMALRIYPTLVLPGTELEALRSRGAYEQLDVPRAIAWTSAMIVAARDLGFSLQRVGLIETESLHRSVPEGPYHPCFGEFARAESLSALLARNSARGPWALSSRDFSILHAHAGYGVLSLSKKTGLSPSSVSAGFRFLRGAPGMKKKRGVVEE